MDVLLTRALEVLIYPPAGPLLLMLLGGLLLPWQRWLAYGLLGIGWLLLYAASLPATALALNRLLEVYPALNPDELDAHGAQAIVVLGYTRYHAAPEYGGDTSGVGELERLRYAAYVQHRTGLPLAVIGGDPLRTGTSEAEVMERVLTEEWRVPVRWADGRSLNTRDNARDAAQRLEPLGIRRILLVTHAWHMPRAVAAFAAEGFHVIPAPTGFTTRGPATGGWRAWVPSATALLQVNRALHELLGLLWYGLLR